jgi:aminoglycoside/choline kinase family phosphotransferase
VEAPEDPAGRPAGVPPEPGLEPLRSFLEAHGLPVPRRYGGDPELGIDLLEDAGDEPLRDAVARAGAGERRALYERACDLVPRLQGLADPGGRVPAFARRLDAALIAYKRDLFLEWSVPAGLGRAPRADEITAVREAFAAIAAAVGAAPLRLAHRDFQSRNLLLRRGAAGAELLMIDIQGAFQAPPEYDLVCLLRDASSPLPADEVAHQLERIRPRLPDAPDAAAFATRFDLLTVSRNAKDHARFVSAARRRGVTHALAFAPAALQHVREAAARLGRSLPELAGFAELAARLGEAPCGR